MAANEYTSGEGASANLFSQTSTTTDYDDYPSFITSDFSNVAAAKKAYDKLFTMTEDQIAALDPFKNPMEYTVAVKMSRERDELIKLVQENAAYSDITGNQKNGYKNAVFKPIAQMGESDYFVISGLSLKTNMQSKMLKAGVSGAKKTSYTGLTTYQETRSTKTLNFYKDKDQIKNLISLMRQLKK